MKVLVGITGASGSVYAERLIGFLNSSEHVDRIYLIMTEPGKQVLQHELDSSPNSEFCLKAFLQDKKTSKKKIRIFEPDNLFAPIASGSSVPDTGVIVPCSMGTLARVAHGFSSNLLERSFDVLIKQRKPFTIVPRETPLSRIHLENMLKISHLGGHVIPAMPGFYHKPKSIEEIVDFVVGKILESLDIHHQLYPQWNKRLI